MPSQKIYSTLTVITAQSIPAAKQILADLNVAEAVHYLDGNGLHDWACTYLGKAVVESANVLNPSNPLIYVSYLHAALLKANRQLVVVYTSDETFTTSLIRSVDLVVYAFDATKNVVVLRDGNLLHKPVLSELEFYVAGYEQADREFVKELKALATKRKGVTELSREPITSPELSAALARSLAYGRKLNECGIPLHFLEADIKNYTSCIEKELSNARILGNVEPFNVCSNERVLNALVEYSKLSIASYFDTSQLDHIDFIRRCVGIPNALKQLEALGIFSEESKKKTSLIISDEHDLNDVGRGTRIGIITVNELTPSDIIVINTIAKDSGVSFLPEYFYFISNTL